jgi:hypothetical protein
MGAVEAVANETKIEGAPQIDIESLYQITPEG